MKQKIHRDYRVEVDVPETPRYFGRARTHEEMLAECKRIKAEVQRHVDFDGNATIQFATVDVCEFCGDEWETDTDGCPVCCQRAVAEWEATSGGAA